MHRGVDFKRCEGEKISTGYIRNLIKLLAFSISIIKMIFFVKGLTHEKFQRNSWNEFLCKIFWEVSNLQLSTCEVTFLWWLMHLNNFFRVNRIKILKIKFSVFGWFFIFRHWIDKLKVTKIRMKFLIKLTFKTIRRLSKLGALIVKWS